MGSLLEVSELNLSFYSDGREIPALQDISFSLEKGEVVGIVGESGSGKSMTSLAVMGLVPRSVGRVNGKVMFNEENLLNCTEPQLRKLRGNHIAMIFQEPMTSLNPSHRIGDQIDEVMLLHESITKKEARTRTIGLLEKVGIPDGDRVARMHPHHLSGGMRQRVMIAMAIACEPKLLIADEPTTALDVTIQAQILTMIQNIQKETGMAVILVTHDLGLVAEYCDRVIVMYAGQIVEECSIEELFRNPRHPYTIGLMNCIPSLDSERSSLDFIPGQPPKLGEIATGCRFYNRCSFSEETCRTKSPVLEQNDEDNHGYRCWFPVKEVREHV